MTGDPKAKAGDRWWSLLGLSVYDLSHFTVVDGTKNITGIYDDTTGDVLTAVLNQSTVSWYISRLNIRNNWILSC